MKWSRKFPQFEGKHTAGRRLTGNGFDYLEIYFEGDCFKPTGWAEFEPKDIFASEGFEWLDESESIPSVTNEEDELWDFEAAKELAIKFGRWIADECIIGTEGYYYLAKDIGQTDSYTSEELFNKFCEATTPSSSSLHS